MRISDWSSDVCSSDLKPDVFLRKVAADLGFDLGDGDYCAGNLFFSQDDKRRDRARAVLNESLALQGLKVAGFRIVPTEMSALGDEAMKSVPVVEQVFVTAPADTHKFAFELKLRSEEHTSELQSLMRISYAVFCLKKKTNY